MDGRVRFSRDSLAPMMTSSLGLLMMADFSVYVNTTCKVGSA